jgi:hypothetical protein
MKKQISYEILKLNSFIQKQDENFLEKMKKQISYEILKSNSFIQEQDENFLDKMKKQISYEILKLNFYSRTKKKLSWENETKNIVRNVKIEIFLFKDLNLSF